MPDVSRFYGIVVGMFFEDHSPPHVHVRYGEFRAKIDIRTLTVLDGRLPPRALGLMIEWMSLHQDELLRNWLALETTGKMEKIAPLP